MLQVDDSIEEARAAVLSISQDPTPQVPSVDEEDFNEYGDEEMRRPHAGSPPDTAETPVPSDSEDYKHNGNGIPCRFYNHDGCRAGASCKFKHAPDRRSVRDDLSVIASHLRR